MADTAKRWGPTLITSAEVTLITVGGSATVVVRNINITNTDSTARTFKMSIGADAAGTRIFDDISVAPDSTFTWTGFLALNASDTLRAQASTTNVLTATISGVETT